MPQQTFCNMWVYEKKEACEEGARLHARALSALCASAVSSTLPHSMASGVNSAQRPGNSPSRSSYVALSKRRLLLPAPQRHAPGSPSGHSGAVGAGARAGAGMGGRPAGSNQRETTGRQCAYITQPEIEGAAAFKKCQAGLFTKGASHGGLSPSSEAQSQLRNIRVAVDDLFATER